MAMTSDEGDWNDFLCSNTVMLPSKLAEVLRELDDYEVEVDFMPLTGEWAVFDKGVPVSWCNTLDEALASAQKYIFPEG